MMKLTMPRLKTTARRKKGISLIELQIGILITAFIGAITIPSMIFLARAMKGFRTDINYQQQLSMFYQQLNIIRSGTTEILINDDGRPELRGLRSSFVPDADEPTGVRYEQNNVTSILRYVDEDDDPDTITDNRLFLDTTVRTKQGTLISSNSELLLEHVSPLRGYNPVTDAIETLPLWQSIPTDGRTYIQLNLRVGDRTRPSEDQWDRITGPGYQGYVVEYIIVPQVAS